MQTTAVLGMDLVDDKFKPDTSKTQTMIREAYLIIL